MNLSKYAKTITALVSGVLGWAAVVISSAAAPVSASEWLGLGVAVATSLGVYAVSNTARSARGAVDPGSAALGALIALAAAWALWGPR